MDLKLKIIASTVQPYNILTKDEFTQLLEGCRHPWDKTIIVSSVTLLSLSISSSSIVDGGVTYSRISYNQKNDENIYEAVELLRKALINYSESITTPL